MTKSQLVAKPADDGGMSRKLMDGLVNDLVQTILTTFVAKEFKESVHGKR
jgi:nucleoid DNA-binding protein